MFPARIFLLLRFFFKKSFISFIVIDNQWNRYDYPSSILHECFIILHGSFMRFLLNCRGRRSRLIFPDIKSWNEQFAQSAKAGCQESGDCQYRQFHQGETRVPLGRYCSTSVETLQYLPRGIAVFDCRYSHIVRIIYPVVRETMFFPTVMFFVIVKGKLSLRTFGLSGAGNKSLSLWSEE